MSVPTFIPRLPHTLDANDVTKWDEWPGDTLVVVPCSKAKSPVPAPVADLYAGPLTRLAIRAARVLVPDTHIRVLSARHGFLHLADTIDWVSPYDTTWRCPEAVSRVTLRAQAEADAFQPDCVVALCPRQYAARVLHVWPEAYLPLARSRGIGDQLHRLNRIAAMPLSGGVPLAQTGERWAVTSALVGSATALTLFDQPEPAGEHLCHARGCQKVVPPRRLMCGRHWAMVPRALQRRVWREYVRGQEERKDPTRADPAAASSAIAFVAQLEGAA